MFHQALKICNENNEKVALRKYQDLDFMTITLIILNPYTY